MGLLRRNMDTSAGEETVELLTVSMVVIVAVGLFTASTASSLARENRITEMRTMQKKAADLTLLLYNSPELTTGVPGEYAAETLHEMGDRLEALYPPENMGFGYHVEIVDTSGYPDRIEMSTAEIPPTTSDTYTYSLPVVLVVSEWERHSGRLVVTIWR